MLSTWFYVDYYKNVWTTKKILLKHLLHIIWFKMKRELKCVVKIINLWIDSKVLKENSWDFLNIESESCWVLFNSLQHELYSPWKSLDRNIRISILSLLQGIFPTQGLNPGLLHCRWILYQLSHKGSPRILEWVAYPFARGSSRPRDWTGVSGIVGSFFTNWAIREALHEV